MSQDSGWYDDPQDPDYLRYFDGVEWTDHRAPKTPPRMQQAETSTGATVAGATPPGVSQGTAPGSSPYVVPGNRPAGERPVGQWPSGAAYPQGMAPRRALTQDGWELASWGQRAGALVLDGVLLSMLLAPFVARLVPDYYSQVQAWADAAVRGGQVSTKTIPTPTQSEALRVTLTMLAMFLVYEVTCLAVWGRTVGRAATGISVRRVEAPARAGVGPLVLRTLIKRLGDVIPGGLGSVFTLVNYLFPLWDRPLQQALHDKAARTCVVRGRLPRQAGPTDAPDGLGPSDHAR